MTLPPLKGMELLGSSDPNTLKLLVPGRNPFAKNGGLLSLPCSKLLKRDFLSVPGPVFKTRLVQLDFSKIGLTATKVAAPTPTPVGALLAAWSRFVNTQFSTMGDTTTNFFWSK
ncbi:hypothetical protein [Kamptonema sp. UHCC 0994]|uniref:hypothetical protein n=1 Tax=Kamptonema sp. UHCC 0994 TaxID=3031329 RepID=UPI0023B99BA0|nr:hypothetical protein [Kamptonema sp. UHCC 0994]MDF0552293.1 hypothetical protein [Kamptonema sp. UHCC 0994]